MKISLIRHGMTAANERGIYCGSTDIDLCDAGVKELLTLKRTVAYPEAGVFATSGLKRTVSTLYALYGAVDHLAVPELAEYDFGDFEMKAHEELQNSREYIEWIENEDARCPNGESRREFNSRVMEGFNKLKNISGDVICVCHGGVAAALMEALFPGKKGFYGWRPGFGRGYTVSFGVDIHYAMI